MTDPALATSWNHIRAELRQAVSESTWHGWLESLELRELIGDVLLVEAPDDTRAWVGDRFGRLLQACAAAVLGPDLSVELVAPGVHTPPAHIVAPDIFNPKLTFEQFVLGKSNQLAHAAALAVAELPGLAYNPLYICGRPGLGKTHLLHSIANYVRAYGDGTTVRYTTAEAFTSEYVLASRSGGMEAFKARFRGVGVLLVDDVQFLQQKVKTEEEFFHTFNEIHAAGAQIVLTSDRPPRDLEGLEDRLRARFEAGLVTQLDAPDAVTRAAILRKRVIQDGLAEIDDAALELIAARVNDSVRALEGALIRVVAFASLTGRPATHELAAEVLGGLYPDLRTRSRTVTEIQSATCEAFGVSLEDLRSTSRTASIAWARQVAMYLSRELTDATLPAIGKAFDRNHTTVMHAVKKTEARMADDPQAYDAIKRLAQDLGAE